MTVDLVKSNLRAGALHVAAFIGIAVAYMAWPGARKHTIAQTYRYALPEFSEIGPTGCNSDPREYTNGRCETDYIFAPPSKLFTFNVIYGVLFFFAFTALAHYFYGTDGFGRGLYSKAIADGWNPYRWIEYGISASVMSVLIGYTLGVHDGFFLGSLFLITAAMQMCGYVVEAALKGHQSYSKSTREIVSGASYTGWLLLAALWIPIIASFITLIRDLDVKNYVDDSVPPKKITIPGWVWFIVIVQLYQYSQFGFVQARQIRDAYSGKKMPYSFYESKYISLSFTAKVALAAGLGYGLLWRTRECPV